MRHTKIPVMDAVLEILAAMGAVTGIGLELYYFKMAGTGLSDAVVTIRFCCRDLSFVFGDGALSGSVESFDSRPSKKQDLCGSSGAWHQGFIYGNDRLHSGL